MLPICNLTMKLKRLSKNINSLHSSKFNFKCLRNLTQKVEVNPNLIGTSGDKKKYQNFKDLVIQRRDESKRSVVVQVNSEKSFPELWKYCVQFGKIKGAYHYSIQNDLHYILIEYEDLIDSELALNSCQFNEETIGVPVKSNFVWFRAGQKPIVNTKSKNKKLEKFDDSLLSIENGTETIPNESLSDLLKSAPNFEDQVSILFQTTCLNDLGIRLRFLAAKQIETSVHGMFPHAKAYPFGSSVNGFGKMGCDLDLILRLTDEKNDNKSTPKSYSRLIFHTKENLANGRSQTQRQMESIGDMMQLFLPGVSQVRRILQARVPIIKYHHDHLDLEVDLSMSNMTGVYMSELLFMFGQLDHRVRSLTFCIRKWAQCVGLTNPSPGRWISNFSLTTLVIFFLQQLKEPILPPVNLLIQNATKEDIRITEDDINCTFLRDLNQLNFTVKNTDNYETLLLKFYEFYAQFDFHNKGISLNEGKAIIKPDHSAMYIVNPLETFLNVSKNVSFEETERFRIEVRNAAWILESNVTANNNVENKSSNWGLLHLFKMNQKNIIKPNMFFKQRMVDVSELFNPDELNDHSNVKNISAIEFKNSYVKNSVNSIKNKSKSDLKQLKDIIMQQHKR